MIVEDCRAGLAGEAVVAVAFVEGDAAGGVESDGEPAVEETEGVEDLLADEGFEHGADDLLQVVRPQVLEG